jgi:hypothetical protein
MRSTASSRRRARRVDVLAIAWIYRLDAAPLRAVHDWTAEYEHFWHERINRLKRHLDR